MIVAVGLMGLIVGSFVNVLIARFKEIETILNTRSRCVTCQKVIVWYDLVPLLSFLILSGRCRWCRERISWQYPFVELLTAAIALHLNFVFGISWLSLALFLILSLLLGIAVIDWRHQVVPDIYMLPCLLLAFGISFSLPINLTALGVIVGGGFLVLMSSISREQWLGHGDASFGMLLGLLTGFSGTLVGLAVAFILGSFYGVMLISTGRAKGNSRIAFGPFLAVGLYLAIFYGDMISAKYLALIGF